MPTLSPSQEIKKRAWPFSRGRQAVGAVGDNDRNATMSAHLSDPGCDFLPFGHRLAADKEEMPYALSPQVPNKFHPLLKRQFVSLLLPLRFRPIATRTVQVAAIVADYETGS